MTQRKMLVARRGYGYGRGIARGVLVPQGIGNVVPCDYPGCGGGRCTRSRS